MSQRQTVLVVDDNPDNLDILLSYLDRERFRVLVAGDGRSALASASAARPDIILLDVMLPDMKGYEVCRHVKADPQTAHIPVIFITALTDVREKLAGFDAGGVDYLTKPLQHEEVLARINTHLLLKRYQEELEEANAELESRVEARTVELSEEVEQRRRAEEQLKEALGEVNALKDRLQAENVYLKQELQGDNRLIVGRSKPLGAMLEKVRCVASSDTSVLITGETGTGKELIAQAIHDASRRRDKPLVKLNCAAISAGLVESELFGHVRGAFTGAADKRTGRFQVADGGTLFLDEVSELPSETQVKLLRVLQEQEFEPVGSSVTKKVDVRIVAATNRDLGEEVAAGRFRADLYYRLGVFPIQVPALRERHGDIPLLVEHFMNVLSRKLGRELAGVEPATMQKLEAHSWPGNVRELRNTIERAILLSRGRQLTVEWSLGDGASERRPARTELPVADAPVALADVEREHIIGVLRRTRGIVEGPSGAAQLLNMRPSTARYRMKKLGIRKSDYRS